MNYLQLANRLRRKCRVSGSGFTTTQSTQVEEYYRLLDWVNEAWVDIQLKRTDWLWMKKSMSFPTVLSQASYTVAQIGLTDFANWDLDTFRTYNTAVGLNSEIEMDNISYDDWRSNYQLGALRSSTSRPIEFAVLPDLSIGVGPVPIAGYTVTGEYYKVPTEFALDADIPGLPVQYHMAIIYRAMMFYGASELASEVYQEGEKEFALMMNRLGMTQLVDITLPGALA